MNTNKFGEEIRVKMARDQLTYRSAGIEGVPMATLFRLSKGETIPTSGKLVSICVWLDLDPRVFWLEPYRPTITFRATKKGGGL